MSASEKLREKIFNLWHTSFECGAWHHGDAGSYEQREKFCALARRELEAAIDREVEEAKTPRHTDHSIPCPTCGDYWSDESESGP